MNRIFITVSGVEHELNPDDFNEVLKILRKNKNYDCFINIQDNYVGLIWPYSNAVCSYMCVFMDYETPLYTSGVKFSASYLTLERTSAISRIISICYFLV